MTEIDFERQLERRLQARAAIASRPFDAAAMANRIVSDRSRRRIAWPVPWATDRATLILLIALALGAILAAGLVVGSLEPRPTFVAGPTSNGWIAYSTAPPLIASTDYRTGSDVYIVREGEAPRLIAGRDGGTTWNACPIFSPDGRHLSYTVRRAGQRSVVVLDVATDGSVTERVRFDIDGESTPCTRWSKDGTRVGYMSGRGPVMHRLDGSIVASSSDDLGPGDFNRFVPPDIELASPVGNRSAWLMDCTLWVGRLIHHGVPVVDLVDRCPYDVATWSPDGTRVLLMQDVGGAFAIDSVAVDDASPELVTIVPAAPVNGQRSWPGRGDVSWQPVLP